MPSVLVCKRRDAGRKVIIVNGDFTMFTRISLVKYVKMLSRLMSG
jgi:hypothetical protein